MKLCLKISAINETATKTAVSVWNDFLEFDDSSSALEWLIGTLVAVDSVANLVISDDVSSYARIRDKIIDECVLSNNLREIIENKTGSPFVSANFIDCQIVDEGDLS